ncbi:hypothetical protein FYK55_25095 [Roseiconus nitratireducens]|uniref:Tetratricopeptide repeat protein n=1 Tax=Roseiconus nitratireducens TaxID=2605748 RepID=A0A5M6CXQ6_9BACT|nr:hypothetical protein [Roseiconus nitratireducens]KAA5539200.1 hypothetical protein FYK55_25095 [Roseiconus nitratireducens]
MPSSHAQRPAPEQDDSTPHPALPLSTEIPTSVVNHLRASEYQQAIDVLRTLARTPLRQHTLGVCALRLGRFEEAVTIFSRLCLSPGSVMMRSDVDDVLQINYATAILLSGAPSGAMEILQGLHDPSDGPAVALRLAVANWVSGLPWWRRLDWKLNRIDPPHASVPLPFAPGVFPFAVKPVSPPGPESAGRRARPAAPDLAA